MPKSTVHRILRVFEQHGFLARDLDTRRFRLGLAPIELGRRAQEGLELRKIALPIMEHMSSVSGETVLLQVVSAEGDRVVCIEHVHQRAGLHLMLEVGSTAPIHAGCASKVLLAFLNEPTRENLLGGELRPLTSHTITDANQLRAQLGEIRRNGYAVSFEETDEGIAGVSVPVRDSQDRVIAGVTISGPLTRVNASTMSRYIDIALDGSRRIAAELGHKPSRLALRGATGSARSSVS
jgi:DNA-binding IclR family transcriptional regulator